MTRINLTLLGVILFCVINNFCNGQNISIPNLFLTADRTNLSDACKYDLFYVARGMIKQEHWALKFFDSSGRTSSGLLSGNLFEWGHFSECYELEHLLNSNRTIFGKYCLGSYSILPNFSVPEDPSAILMSSILKIGLCVPDSCTNEDLNKLLQPLYLTEKLCYSQTKDKELPPGAIGTICLIGFAALIAILSTIYDLCTSYLGIKNRSPLFLAYSLPINIKEIFKTSKSTFDLNCLEGMKSISLAWVIIGHGLTYNTMSGVMNFTYFLSMANGPEFKYVNGAFLSVDTFFVIGGLLLTYTFLIFHEKGIKFNLFKFYLRRYLRLTPALLVTVLISKYLIVYTVSGPKREVVRYAFATPCEEWGWLHSLLYIQHYYFSKTIVVPCVLQSWYLNVDFQLYLLSPLILLPLSKWPKRTVQALVAVFFCGIIVPFLVSWYTNLVCPTGTNCFDVMDSTDYDNFNKTFYMTTYCRFGPYVAGLILGYVIYNYKKNNYKYEMSQVGFISYWVFIVIGALLTLYIEIYIDRNSTKLVKSLFVGLQKNIWSCFVCLIIFGCITGNGGVINKFLSLKIFQLIRKVSYSMFLVHLLILGWRNSTLPTSELFSIRTFLFDFWAVFMVTFWVSIIFCLLFEWPIIKLERLMFYKKPMVKLQENKNNSVSTKL